MPNASPPPSGPVLRFTMNYGIRMLLNLAPKFEHLLQPNKLQEDFRFVNPPKNPSTILFADGSKENLSRIVAKCREEGTTFFGAFAASIFLSYIITSESKDDEAFKLALYMNFNMRNRVANPIDPAAVGCFITASEMTVPTINVPTQKF